MNRAQVNVYLKTIMAFMMTAGAILLAACSHTQLTLEPRAITQYQIPYQRFTYGLQPVDDGLFDEGLIIIFPLISGSIFAAPSPLILQISPAEQGVFTFDIPQDVDALASEIQGFDLLIEPKEARILRLGTFYSDGYRSSLGDAGFINGNNGNTLVLTYFSTAVSITGPLHQYGETFEHQLTIKQRGWYWLEISQQGAHHYLVKPYAGSTSQIYLAVLVDEMAAAY